MKCKKKSEEKRREEKWRETDWSCRKSEWAQKKQSKLKEVEAGSLGAGRTGRTIPIVKVLYVQFGYGNRICFYNIDFIDEFSISHRTSLSRLCRVVDVAIVQPSSAFIVRKLVH